MEISILLSGRAKTFLRLCVGTGLLLLLFQMVAWQQVLPLFQTIQWGPFVLAVALYPVSIWVSTKKWKSLLLPHGVTVSSYELFRHYWTGVFLSNFLPSSVGGDVSRVALLGRFGRPAEVAASVLVDRLTGVFVILLVAIGSLTLRPELFRQEWLPLFWALALTLTSGLLGIFFFSGYIASRLPTPPSQHMGWYWLALVKVKKLVTAIALYKNVPAVLWKNLALSLFFYLLSVLGNYLSFQIFSLNISPFDIFFIAGWISLISFIPISLNGLGITEGAFVFFYGTVGVVPAEALAVALLTRFVALLCSSVGGLFLLFPGARCKTLINDCSVYRE